MRNLLFMLIMLAFFASCNKGARNEPKNPMVLNKVEVGISGMSCTGCEETVTKGALALEGVKEATASFKEGKAWVSYEDGKVTLEQISASIEKTGYKVTGISTEVSHDSVQLQNP